MVLEESCISIQTQASGTAEGLGMDKKFISTSSVVTSYTQASGTAEGLAASFALLAAGAGLRAPLSIAR